MEGFVKGDIVIVPFPFSDLSHSKKRPAFVVSALEGDDLVLCQITSKNSRDSYSIQLSSKEFRSGSLKQESNIRPNKLFTADRSLILYRAGSVKKPKTEEVIQKICQILKS